MSRRRRVCARGPLAPYFAAMTDDARPVAFTDAELVAILEAPPEEPTLALGRRLGRDKDAASHARRSLHGGSCPVVWHPCEVCGEPVPLRPPPELPVHLRCRRASRRTHLAERYRTNPAALHEASRRWTERDPERFRAMTRESAQRKKARRPQGLRRPTRPAGRLRRGSARALPGGGNPDQGALDRGRRRPGAGHAGPAAA
jgi:hypothetical protein